MKSLPQQMRTSVPQVRPVRHNQARVGSRTRTGEWVGSGSYMRDVGTPFMFGWDVVVREPVDDTQAAWLMAAGKAIETIHNSGFISGGIDTAVAQMVGNGLQANLQPQVGILGDDKATREWARDVEARFMRYANDPWSVDLGGRYTLGQIEAQAVRQVFATGEIVATLPYVNRVGSTHGSKINLVPSTRLSQTSTQSDRVVQGVQLDRNGAPTGYIFNERDIAGGTFAREVRVAARDELGRPLVAHILDAAPSAVRGMTPLVPILRVVRQYDQLADGTLTAALLQTVFAATIESDSPTKELLTALQSPEEQEDEVEGARPGIFQRFMEQRGLWYTRTHVDLGQKAKMVHLFPGEKLNFNKSEHPNTGYSDLAKGLHREIARCLGITYEQLTGDFTGATYSSVRMAIADMWNINLYRRNHYPARLAQMVFENWLEEDIERGDTPFPGGLPAFLAQRQQVCQVSWRGPPKPTADDLKTAKAQQIQRAEGWVPQSQLAAEYGNDWAEVNEQQEIEMKDREERKLPPVPSLGGGGNGAGSAAVAGGQKPGQPQPDEDEDDGA